MLILPRGQISNYGQRNKMAWHNIVSSTTVDSSDMNDNFLYVGQGSRFPMTSFGADMGYTTGVYDLGSSAFRWGTIYANSISVSGSIATDSGLMTLISEVTLSATANQVDFLNLNGDVYNTVNIFFYSNFSTGGYYFVVVAQLNLEGWTSASVYGWQHLYGESTGVIALRGGAPSGLNIAGIENTVSSGRMFSKSALYLKTGNERSCISHFLCAATGTTVQRVGMHAAIYSKSVNTITSIRISTSQPAFVNFAVGTNIQLWGKK